MSDFWIAFIGILIVAFLTVVLPTLAYLFYGWLFTRFERTRDLGVHFFALSMVAPKLTAAYCCRHCESTPCRNWTCENYSRCKVNDK